MRGTEPLVGAKNAGNTAGAKEWRQSAVTMNNRQREDLFLTAKSFEIPKQLFMDAFRRIKANGGSAGIDGVTIESFERNLKDNLYKIWNRMSSGSYFPAAVKAVAIPKKTGGERILGIPTVSDRTCQMVVAAELEKILDSHFHVDSYGYRPGKSALDAIAITRQRCWSYDWVLEFDVRALFDNIDHDLLLRALRFHTTCPWIILYVQRWLKAPMQRENGQLVERMRGTPQGGCVSPILANLFLHYVFDKWMERNFPNMPFCRYADDGLVHCRTEKQAQTILTQLRDRFGKCGLELHPTKTRIVYCRDGKRTQTSHFTTKFDFLGYTFQGRRTQNQKTKKIFLGYAPAMSLASLKEIRRIIREEWKLHLRVDLSLEQLAERFNPVIRGWFNYYGAFYRAKLRLIGDAVNRSIYRWAQRKYLRLRGHKRNTWNWLNRVCKEKSKLFVHWARL